MNCGAPRLWHRVDGAGSRVAITFDDGDRARAWRRILDVLGQHRVAATFFVLGMRVAQFPALARRTVADGHAIGSHGWDHTRLTGCSTDGVRWRLRRDHRVWQSVAGVSPRPWLRPPYGAHDDAVAAAAAEAGYHQIVLWDVDPADWQEPGARVVAERVLDQVRPGSIIDLHVTEQTAEAMTTILAVLSERKLRPVALPRLLTSEVRP